MDYEIDALPDLSALFLSNNIVERKMSSLNVFRARTSPSHQTVFTGPLETRLQTDVKGRLSPIAEERSTCSAEEELNQEEDIMPRYKSYAFLEEGSSLT